MVFVDLLLWWYSYLEHHWLPFCRLPEASSAIQYLWNEKRGPLLFQGQGGAPANDAMISHGEGNTLCHLYVQNPSTVVETRGVADDLEIIL